MSIVSVSRFRRLYYNYSALHDLSIIMSDGEVRMDTHACMCTHVLVEY